MYLRSLTLKGFKSFPDRTRLDFAPGVSVVVGPNGSGKSNVTDAVLWALGEQSPLAVRGRTMQDVIFAGGRGMPSRSAAEVEVVVDNGDGLLDAPSEISIARRLERSGEGEYRLNGARCRLVDVLEVLSDTGLGKEMHSVVSQGRIEAIVHSRPRDRRLLIEEAAGLGKHRKRRHRAQLKLARTEVNLARARDVEGEARARLRPLKRQAEAADLHERLERQRQEARLELAREEVRVLGVDLQAAETAAASARSERDEAERRLDEMAGLRARAESAFRDHARAREALAGHAWAARSAAERIAMRLERAGEVEESAEDARRRCEAELPSLLPREDETADRDGAERVRALEAAIARLDDDLQRRTALELEALERERAALEAARARLARERERRQSAQRAAERAAEEARVERSRTEQAVGRARAAAAERGAELAEVNALLRRGQRAHGGAPALTDVIRAAPGYELAVAAALGPLLGAAVAPGLGEAERALDAAGDGVVVIAAQPGGASMPPSAPPAAGAERLADHVTSAREQEAVVRRLLADAWVVDALAEVRLDFAGVAVTRSGRVLSLPRGELRQLAQGTEERRLEAVNRREAAIAASERAVAAEAEARARAARAAAIVAERDGERDSAEGGLRAARREEGEAADAVRAAEQRLERRRSTPHEDAEGRRAQLEAELRAERRMEEHARRERIARRDRRRLAEAGIAHEVRVVGAARRARAALAAALEAVRARHEELEGRLEAGRRQADASADEVRARAREEAELGRRARDAGGAVTHVEVRLERARDAAEHARAELEALAAGLGLAAEPAAAPMTPQRRDELSARVERLGRRREQLGPVNPLAREEYEQALDRVAELEAQRGDLESALRELEGLIRDTDREIRAAFDSTFAAAATAFAEVVAHLFPGGRGRLSLAAPDSQAGSAGDPSDAGEADEPDAELADEPGVEVEVTPAGKSMRSLSLLSGGEKSLVALAFMFAVFLARPCPFYILDEVEAALDDRNIDRFLQLVRRYADRAQFIIVTHQRRTMDAADCLYGISMADDGVSRVVSRRLDGAAAMRLESSRAA